MDFDIIIVGAGPAGLCFAKSLAESNLRVALLERQPLAAIAEPAFDGREIALTHASAQLMQHLGLWQHIDAAEISPLQVARIQDGPSAYALDVFNGKHTGSELGYLIPNHLIRKAAYACVKEYPNITLIADTQVTGVQAGATGAQVWLVGGKRLDAALVVAADSRFSETRRAMGIAASMHDFGKTMLVCRMEHDLPHEQTALEWFDYGQTIAFLPLRGNCSSFVLTLPHRDIRKLMEMSEDDFAAQAQRRMRDRFGKMRLASTRHAYPLVGVYPHRFIAERFAVVGDAAVGMHPVTAHGFNFGLLGQDILANEILTAHANGRDFSGESVLARYERLHRLATRPLYETTRLIAALYTDDRLPARVLRKVALHAGNRLPFFKPALAAMLTQKRYRMTPLAALAGLTR